MKHAILLTSILLMGTTLTVQCETIQPGQFTTLQLADGTIVSGKLISIEPNGIHIAGSSINRIIPLDSLSERSRNQFETSLNNPLLAANTTPSPLDKTADRVRQLSRDQSQNLNTIRSIRTTFTSYWYMPYYFDSYSDCHGSLFDIKINF